MLSPPEGQTALDAQTIEQIAARVVTALHDDLEVIAARLSAPQADTTQLTVEQVAYRLGLSRSTVYAHWREWGGYKLGTGEKAPIRFDSGALPVARPATPPPEPEDLGRAKRARRRRRSRLLADAPKLIEPLDRIA
jgi:hypothetical protein